MPESSCQCLECQLSCAIRPGYFAPGEAEKAAELLGLTMKQFFDQHLVAELPRRAGWMILVPASGGNKPGTVDDRDVPVGRCVFFGKDGKCSIYAARPLECRLAHHDHTSDENQRIHDQIGYSWQHNQAEIRSLLS